VLATLMIPSRSDDPKYIILSKLGLINITGSHPAEHCDRAAYSS